MRFQVAEDGSIGEILYVRSPFETLVSYLREKKNVFDIFDFQGKKDLAGAQGPFPIILNIPHFYEFTGDFYTSLPLFVLDVHPAGEGRFQGVVRSVDLLPNIRYSSSNLFLYIDEQQKLKAFNRNLHQLFSGEFKEPEEMLDLPLNRFLSPTPAEVEKEYIRTLPAPARPEERFSLETLPPDRLTAVRGRLEGRVWSNAGENNAFLHFLCPIDTSRQDFDFNVKAEVRKGFAPLMLLGAEKTDIRDPDYDGYLAGENAERSGYVLKKRGYIIRRSGVSPAEAEFTLSKRGRALFFSATGREAIRCYDADFIRNPRALLCLSLRPGSEVRFEKVEWNVRTGADRSDATERIVKIRSSPARYFSITEFQNTALNAARPSLYGYILNDVTELAGKAEQYKGQYERARRKESELSTRLEEFKAGRGGGEHSLFLGWGPALSRIREQAETVAASAASVLIQGPTGTGKEVLARFIHDHGDRRDCPFVKVDCSALPRALVESELFGHEKGAFTGAQERKIGRFEQAHGGTLFLDEVANLDREIQGKLLNALQDHAITRVGGSEPVRLDIRVLSASNMDLERLAATGAFREDLLFRINAITINLPPLALRKEDIPELCRFFITVFNRANNKLIKGLTPAAHRVLDAYAWPGNIRELRNVMQRAVLFCDRPLIGPEHIQLPAPETNRRESNSYHLQGLNRSRLLQIVKRHQGIVSRIAGELSVSRQACYDNLKKYRIDVSRFRRQ